MRLEDEELTGRETAQDAGITAVAMGGHPFVPARPCRAGTARQWREGNISAAV